MPDNNKNNYDYDLGDMIDSAVQFGTQVGSSVLGSIADALEQAGDAMTRAAAQPERAADIDARCPQLQVVAQLDQTGRSEQSAVGETRLAGKPRVAERIHRIPDDRAVGGELEEIDGGGRGGMDRRKGDDPSAVGFSAAC